MLILGAVHLAKNDGVTKTMTQPLSARKVGHGDGRNFTFGGVTEREFPEC